MADYIYSAIPEFAAVEDEELRAELVSSTEANVAQVLRMLAHGASAEDASVPHEALAFLRGNVRRDIPLAALLRSYRLGHAWLWQHWVEALQEQVVDPAELAADQDESSTFMFEYVDKICDALVEEFGTEQERRARNAVQLRAQTARTILAGDPVDVERASWELGYELRRHHLALRISSGATEVEGLERAVGEAAAALGADKPLVIPSGAARFDIWCGSLERPSMDALERYRPPAGVDIAFGRPAEGVAGFRASHDEAVQAARIYWLGKGRIPPVTSYERVQLVSLLASDLPRAQVFVAGRLGDLACSDEAAERLRHTVLAFLASGGRAKRVAEDLFIHANTVSYRVKKAEEMLGHAIDEDPVELTCALMLAEALGPAVLGEEKGPVPAVD